MAAVVIPPPSNQAAALRLLRAERVGPTLVNRVLRRFSTVDAIVAAARQDRSDAQLTRVATALVAPVADEDAVLARWNEGTRVFTVFDADYPQRLRRLADPPLALFVRGVLPHDWPEPNVVIVGSRRASPYGLRMARELAADLAAAGAVVGSGLAYGVDVAAHRGALAAAGRTWACVPAGLDALYPSDHRAIADAIVAQQGSLVGEYEPGTGVQTFHFPQRNRLLAALADVVIVVEGHARSGALITADAALELGVDVMAVPHRVGEELAAAPLKLLQAGAPPAIDADAVLAVAGWVRRARARPDAAPDVAPHLKDLWIALPPGGGLHVDDVAHKLQRDVRDVLSGFLELEIAGWVESLPGKHYARSVRRAARASA